MHEDPDRLPTGAGARAAASRIAVQAPELDAALRGTGRSVRAPLRRRWRLPMYSLLGLLLAADLLWHLQQWLAPEPEADNALAAGAAVRAPAAALPAAHETRPPDSGPQAAAARAPAAEDSVAAGPAEPIEPAAAEPIETSAAIEAGAAATDEVLAEASTRFAAGDPVEASGDREGLAAAPGADAADAADDPPGPPVSAAEAAEEAARLDERLRAGDLDALRARYAAALPRPALAAAAGLLAELPMQAPRRVAEEAPGRWRIDWLDGELPRVSARLVRRSDGWALVELVTRP